MRIPCMYKCVISAVYLLCAYGEVGIVECRVNRGGEHPGPIRNVLGGTNINVQCDTVYLW